MFCKNHPSQKLIDLFTSSVCDICEEECKVGTGAIKQTTSSGQVTTFPPVQTPTLQCYGTLMHSPSGLAYWQYFCAQCKQPAAIDGIYVRNWGFELSCPNNHTHGGEITIIDQDYYGCVKGGKTTIFHFNATPKPPAINFIYVESF